MSSESDDDNEAGQPAKPKDGRFQAGQPSRNPKGRPRKSETVGDVFLGAVNEKVPIKQGGRSSQVTKLKAAAMQMANQGAAGDQRAAKLVLEHAQKAEDRKAAAPAPIVLGPSDLEIVARMKDRLRLIIKDEDLGSDNAG
jgi:hypothetical protein